VPGEGRSDVDEGGPGRGGPVLDHLLQEVGSMVREATLVNVNARRREGTEWSAGMRGSARTGRGSRARSVWHSAPCLDRRLCVLELPVQGRGYPRLGVVDRLQAAGVTLRQAERLDRLGWPKSMRVIVRRRKLAPGEQPTRFRPITTARLPKPGPNSPPTPPPTR
jgi:hypothetical protein